MIRFPAKCALFGEHSVLRGYSALVLPLPYFSTTLTVVQNTKAVRFWLNGREIVLPDFLQDFLSPLTEDLSFTSTVPEKSGLGSSAAFCACVATRFYKKGFIGKEEIFSKALELENYFHGKSSGLDVAGVMSCGLTRYQMNRPPERLDVSYKPFLYVSYCGTASATKDAVQKVYAHPKTAYIDQEMSYAGDRFLHGLMDESLAVLKEAMDRGYACFEQWDLVKPFEEHRSHLLASGALAVKPTGAGDGGYMLSLWQDSPPSSLSLIPVFS